MTQCTVYSTDDNPTRCTKISGHTYGHTFGIGEFNPNPDPGPSIAVEQHGLAVAAALEAESLLARCEGAATNEESVWFVARAQVKASLAVAHSNLAAIAESKKLGDDFLNVLRELTAAIRVHGS